MTNYELFKKTIDDQGRNEWIPILKTAFKSNATAKALKLSKKFLEVEVRGIDSYDDELVFHAFYRNGKLEIDMSV
jgi:hypothetical protein